MKVCLHLQLGQLAALCSQPMRHCPQNTWPQGTRVCAHTSISRHTTHSKSSSSLLSTLRDDGAAAALAPDEVPSPLGPTVSSATSRLDAASLRLRALCSSANGVVSTFKVWWRNKQVQDVRERCNANLQAGAGDGHRHPRQLLREGQTLSQRAATSIILQDVTVNHDDSHPAKMKYDMQVRTWRCTTVNRSNLRCSDAYVDSEIHNLIHPCMGCCRVRDISRGPSQIDRALRGCNWGWQSRCSRLLASCR